VSNWRKEMRWGLLATVRREWWMSGLFLGFALCGVWFKNFSAAVAWSLAGMNYIYAMWFAGQAADAWAKLAERKGNE
jgi:hypothetical protein